MANYLTIPIAKKPKMKAKVKRKVMCPGGETPKLDGTLMRIGEEPNVLRSRFPADDGNALPDGAGKEKKCGWLKQKIKIATWNVRTLTSGKLQNVLEETDENGVDILGIAEHRWSGKGHFKPESGGLVTYSGRDKSGLSGVALYVSTRCSKYMLGYNPISDRIMSIRLKGVVKNITIFQIYAPTSAATEDQTNNFYSTLQDHVNNTAKDVVIIMGDFNAKVGSLDLDNPSEKGLIGRHGLGERNSNGEHLVEFAIANQFTIMNTTFKKHSRRLYTWTSPDGLSRNQIDYILIQRRWNTAISNTQTIIKADCNSDHELLSANFKLRLKATKKCDTPIRYDFSIKNDCFSVEVKNKFEALAMVAEEQTPNELAESAKEIFINAAEKHLKPRRIRKQPWISKETLDTMADRKTAKLEYGMCSDEYRELAKQVRSKCRQDKKRFIIEKCEKIEEHMIKHETREMYKTINSMKKTFQPRSTVIKDEQGKILTESQHILDRWQRYCEEMFKINGLIDNTTTIRRDTNDTTTNDEPLFEEVEWAINTLKDRKSPGYDNITSEMIKAAGEEGAKIYHILCKKIWECGIWPTDWRRAVFVVLPKKGDLQMCSNHRTISLISHASKILLKIIMKRMESKLEKEVNQSQAGFRKGRGTRDQIFNLRSIIEKYRENNKSLYVCFIDYSKAFDCVYHQKLWECMYDMNFDHKIINLIRSLYEDQESAVRLEIGTSEWFPIEKGVRQGCILSPHLFNIYTENIMRDVEEDSVDIDFKEPNVQGRKIKDLRYADDTALLSETVDGLHQLIRSTKKHSEKSGLQLNIKKTKIMNVGKGKEEPNIVIDKEAIENVSQFVYLGARFDNKGSTSNEIKRRLAIATASLQQMKNIWKAECDNTKIRILRTCIFPIATYGCESWTIGKQDEKRINAFELKCYRKILRIPWTARKTNTAVLAMLNIQESWLLNSIKRRKLQYFGHVKRRSNNNMEKDIMEATVEGKRGRGRPARRWSDDIKEWTGVPVSEVGRLAADRDGFRKAIWEATTSRPS